MIKFIYSLFLFAIVTTSQAQNIKDYLLPKPQYIQLEKGNMINTEGRLFFPLLKKDSRFFPSAKKISKAFQEYGIDLDITASLALNEEALVSIKIDSLAFNHKQAYSLNISSNKFIIVASEAQSVHYAINSLLNILRFAKENSYIPQLSIKDWPDFPNRGIMIDISRDKVPSITELFKMIKRFSKWNINQLQLYSEHTFAYHNHKIVWEQFSPYTAEDILNIDRFCYDNFIQLVPNQNSLGHMERWLEHEEFLPLAELQKINPNGPVRLRERTTINPLDSKSVDLIDEMYNELLPNFRTKLVNIGGDEPWELGHGKTKQLALSIGKDKVYLNYMRKLFSSLENKGHTIQMWADIVLQHPKSIKFLPKNIQCLIWGYNRNFPFDKKCKIMSKANIPFYVCPGTSTWRSFIGRIPNALANQRNAALNGKKYGAIGYLNTDWGDHGHWQAQILSYPVFIYGAALSWAVDANIDLDVEKKMSENLFNNNTKLAKLLIQLGEASSIVEKRDFPSFYRVFLNADSLNSNSLLNEIKIKDCESLKINLNEIFRNIKKCGVNSKEETLSKQDMLLVNRFALHVNSLSISKLETQTGRLSEIPKDKLLKLKLELQELIADYRVLWVKRNRIGGLQRSCKKLNVILEQYKNQLK